jgi:hypothetical protein
MKMFAWLALPLGEGVQHLRGDHAPCSGLLWAIRKRRTSADSWLTT